MSASWYFVLIRQAACRTGCRLDDGGCAIRKLSFSAATASGGVSDEHGQQADTDRKVGRWRRTWSGRPRKAARGDRVRRDPIAARRSGDRFRAGDEKACEAYDRFGRAVFTWPQARWSTAATRRT
jgi:hypothetical protein